MTRPATSWARRILAQAALLAVAACGGGGGGDGGGGPLNITTSTADDGVIDAAYSDTIVATGGSGAKTFSISGGSLPAGLSMSAAGAISGTPAGPAGTASFTVSVTDSANTPATDTQALTIDIVELLVIQTAALADTSVGADYDDSVIATGGTAPYSFAVSSGSLPNGIAIDAAGALSGTVLTNARTENFTIEVSDSSSPQLTATQEYTVRVAMNITTTALADATGGVAYSDSIVVRGGLPPFEWTLLAGVLPAGLAGPDAATGVISGTPDAVCLPAAGNLTVEVSDSDTPTQTDTQAGIDITVNPAELSVTTVALPSGRVDSAYNQLIQVSGGVPPFLFAVTGGSLPSQLTLNANTGRITGTPDTIETQAFEVTVTDSCPNTASQDLSIAINDASLGRNDNIANATALPGDGSYAASISPSGDPNTVFSSDEDYYAITTTASSTVTVDIDAVVNGSPLDSVVEIVGANGVQLTSCVAPGFTSACEHDDEDTEAGALDSFLEIEVSGATTFYLHVVDWGGNARPDKLYTLNISGVN